MADNLPRPSTPGPWEAYGDDVLATYRGRIETLAMLDGDGTDDPVADAEAIAALPERIRRMDAVRAWCDDQIGQCDEARARGEIEMAHLVLRAAAARVQTLLDGEGSDA